MRNTFYDGVNLTRKHSIFFGINFEALIAWLRIEKRIYEREGISSKKVENDEVKSDESFFSLLFNDHSNEIVWKSDRKNQVNIHSVFEWEKNVVKFFSFWLSLSFSLSLSISLSLSSLSLYLLSLSISLSIFSLSLSLSSLSIYLSILSLSLSLWLRIFTQHRGRKV